MPEPTLVAPRTGRLLRSSSVETTVVNRIRQFTKQVSLPLAYVYMIWCVILLEPHRWLAAWGPAIFSRALAPLLLLLTLLTAIYAIISVHAKGRFVVYLPMGLYVCAAFISSLGAYNRGKALDVNQYLTAYYLLTLATALLVRKPSLVQPILLLWWGQYLWWAYFARQTARVLWHPLYINTDGFGALAVMGIGLCYAFALACKWRILRVIAIVLTVYCLHGLVASIARGATVAAAGLLVFIWLKSPRKLLGFIGIAGAIGIIAASSAALHPGGAFWAEMKTIFTENTEEGTGRDRKELWKAAYEIYRENPVVGVGGGNFGPYAAVYFGTREVHGYPYPARLYDRDLHSMYFQILSEFGTVGCLLLLWLLADFWVRNVRLRRPERCRLWRQKAGSLFNLRYVALALETAMVAYLLTGFFYAQLYSHWMYTLLATNFVLYRVTTPPKEVAPRQVPLRVNSWVPETRWEKRRPPEVTPVVVEGVAGSG